MFLAISGISFGMMPIFAKLAYQTGVGVIQLLFMRFLFAFIALGLVLFAFHKLKLPRKRDLGLLIVMGALGYFLMSTFYFTALLYSPVAIVELILYTYPAFVIIGSRLLGWEGITRRMAGSVVVAMTGLLLVANPLGAPLGLGAILAFLNSVAYTAYILGGTNILKRVKGELASFYVMGGACLSFAVASGATGSILPDWQPIGWVWILMLALVSGVVAMTTFFLGLTLIGPSRSSIISLLEPLTASAAAFVVFAQTLSTVQVVGGALILVSAFTMAFSGSAGGGSRPQAAS